MTRLLISIKTLAPLYAGAFKPYGSFLETHAEISGALLRGAVASRTLPDCAAPELLNNHEACEVKDICPFYYLTTGVAFPTCAIADATHPTEPPLRAMVTCKAAPGFASQSTTREPKHGVFDTLLAHIAFNELRRLGVRPPKLPPQRCKTCDAPLEPFGKRYVREASGRYHSVSLPRTRRMTHVGINRRRETAEQGLLFSVQSIAEGAQFVGRMTAPESWDESRVKELKQLLKNITRIGGEQTYGLGRVEITVKEADGDDEDVPTRARKFNAKLKEVWSEYGGTGEPQGDYFTIDLLTPPLLTMPDGTPTVQLTADMLKERAAELGFYNLPDVEQVCCPDDAGVSRPLMFTAPIMVAGWSDAWGLPKPPALAAVAGSVYVFRTDDIGAWHDALTKIEAHGIGARHEEGFGAVRVCDPFHREVEAK
jgi:CRISPR-associated protein Csx10